MEKKHIWKIVEEKSKNQVVLKMRMKKQTEANGVMLLALSCALTNVFVCCLIIFETRFPQCITCIIFKC